MFLNVRCRVNVTTACIARPCNALGLLTQPLAPRHDVVIGEEWGGSTMAQQSEHNMHLEKEVCNCSRRTRWRSTVEVDRLRDCKMKDCKMKEYPGCSGNEMIYEGCKKKRVG